MPRSTGTALSAPHDSECWGGEPPPNGLHSLGERSTVSGLGLSAVHRESRVMSRSVNHPRHGPKGTPLARLRSAARHSFRHWGFSEVIPSTFELPNPD